MNTATSFARKLHFTKKEEDIPDINRKQFIFENLDKEDILKRLSLMKADNMYVIHHSLNHKALDNLQKEIWFDKEFAVSKLSDDHINKLNFAIKPEDMQIGHPPPNKYMPHNLKKLKKQGETPLRPIRIPMETKLFRKIFC